MHHQGQISLLSFVGCDAAHTTTTHTTAAQCLTVDVEGGAVGGASSSSQLSAMFYILDLPPRDACKSLSGVSASCHHKRAGSAPHPSAERVRWAQGAHREEPGCQEPGGGPPREPSGSIGGGADHHYVPSQALTTAGPLASGLSPHGPSTREALRAMRQAMSRRWSLSF
jgi:hypothetical protein